MQQKKLFTCFFRQACRRIMKAEESEAEVDFRMEMSKSYHDHDFDSAKSLVK
jgi:hypothetical protein